MKDTNGPAVGVVGLGGMGTRHAENLAECGCEVVAGVDLDPDARSRFRAAFDARTYDDHARLFVEEDLDGVVITTPNKFHAPAAVAALERDVHVLCEKPLADSLANAERIADAASASDAHCAVGFHNRLNAAPAVFTELREEGRFGDVSHVEANYVRRRGIPGVGSWFTNRELSGGGALIDIGVHAIDFALYLAGYPDVVEVSGSVRRDFADAGYANPDHFFGDFEITEEDVFDVEDSANAFVRCADGTTIALDVAWATNRPPTDAFVVRGTDGGARCRIGGDSLEVFECGTSGTDHYADAELTGEFSPAGYAAEAERFAACLREGEAPALGTVEEALAVQRVMDAIYESSERGTAVSLDGSATAARRPSPAELD